jgi:ubiquitin C-terminal hydrolase
MRNSQFKGYAQQDSQEFLVTLLESMGEDLSRVDRKSAPYRELTADTKTKSIAKIVTNLLNSEPVMVGLQQTAR